MVLKDVSFHIELPEITEPKVAAALEVGIASESKSNSLAASVRGPTGAKSAACRNLSSRSELFDNVSSPAM